ncbi:MAG: selT/selW/selH-like putative selenoprotein [Candidatus Azotimanducaceae bacterium]
MAAELESAFGVKSALFPEGKGIFNVLVDGKVVFSKYELNRFPKENEITHILKSV